MLTTKDAGKQFFVQAFMSFVSAAADTDKICRVTLSEGSI